NESDCTRPRTVQTRYEVYSCAAATAQLLKSQMRENVMDEHATPESILQVGLGFWPSKVLLSAVEMELFTDLAKGPQSLESLQGRLGLHPRSARDFLDTLVALGFLLRAGGEYSNTPATDMFLDKH